MSENKKKLYGTRKYYKNTFEKISVDRRERILNSAMKEFAAHGYEGASINTIAKKAEISIGSLYSYFASKEDLYLSLIDIGFSLIKEIFDSINTNENIFYVLNELLKTTKEHAIRYPELNQLYLDLTTQSTSKLSELISWKLEEITSKIYKEIISKAKIRGEIKSDVNNEIIAFFIDNIVVTYQFSFSSVYYKKRMRIFLNGNLENDEEIRAGLIKLIKNSLLDK